MGYAVLLHRRFRGILLDLGRSSKPIRASKIECCLANVLKRDRMITRTAAPYSAAVRLIKIRFSSVAHSKFEAAVGMLGTLTTEVEVLQLLGIVPKILSIRSG